MGYASWIEEILEELNANLEKLALKLKARPPNDPDVQEAYRVLLGARELASQIKRDLDYLRDPRIDLVATINELKERNAKLVERNNSLFTEAKRLQTKLENYFVLISRRHYTVVEEDRLKADLKESLLEVRKLLESHKEHKDDAPTIRWS